MRWQRDGTRLHGEHGDSGAAASASGFPTGGHHRLRCLDRVSGVHPPGVRDAPSGCQADTPGRKHTEGITVKDTTVKEDARERKRGFFLVAKTEDDRSNRLAWAATV